MAAACCLSRRSEGAALRSHRPTSRHPFLREAASGLGAGRGVSCPATAVQRTPLAHIILHPRLGKQQYKGEVDLEDLKLSTKSAPTLCSTTETCIPRMISVLSPHGSPDWQVSSSAAGYSPILPWRWNTSKEPRFLPMKWRKSGTTTHRGLQRLSRATARR